MSLNTIKLRDDCGAVLQTAFAIAATERAKGRYTAITDSDVMSAYNACRDANLRYDRAQNIMRDNRLGVLSRPSNPSEWIKASATEAREYLAREVWCKAVQTHNRALLD